MLSWPTKDPEEVLDYVVEWAARLDGDTIDTSTFFVAAGTVVIDSDTSTTDTATVWLSGGKTPETCIITNRITTSGSRTMDQSMRLSIRTK